MQNLRENERVWVSTGAQSRDLSTRNDGKTPSEEAENKVATMLRSQSWRRINSSSDERLKGRRETAKRRKGESGSESKKRNNLSEPPLPSSGRGEWWVPRPQLPPALVAGLTAALGRGVVVVLEASAFMMNLLQIVRDHWVHILVPVGFVVGCYLDRKNDEKLIAFRNKSLLYKRELRPSEEVTWK
ncbi:NADH dehydrogenase [ubiquinone] 1 beta subcomplex subunit 1 [Neophocaena asiaeorientalis asiaeorientalis]|uniref:NADH dehydrogenase [ubiquinone] 1 beta subcomplex subunit 1 n=1 Tax=Neophocaena asiaeorientalis asiaeorientalis TaxID=1706337 RepID=A0A341AQ53_NEOAA|nr:NADH dehydrogenase [ubiquinone] 1 beta subcomplex subunit 1 [Neophocaena asiaeorientalis asiaeorientalis]